MKLYVKYMVSIRCRLIAKDALEQLGYPYCNTSKGMIQLPLDLKSDDRKAFAAILRDSGMVLLNKKKSSLVDKMDRVFDQLFKAEKVMKAESIPSKLEKETGEKYEALANLISEVKGISMEHYQLIKKIELIKECLIYDDITLTRLAEKVGFGTRAKLSYQFKKITGLSPTYFKILREKRFKDTQTVANKKYV